jgi:PBP1b-binding outer membrane lipoprotein LpoB
MRTTIALLGLAIIAGCASEPAPPQQVASAAQAKPNQTCHREAPVGSYRPQTVCYDSDGDQIDPNDPNKQRAVDDAVRQTNQMKSIMSRANGGGR